MAKHYRFNELFLKELYFSGSISCADLSERIGKSIPFTVKHLNQLIGEGYIVESGFAPSSGGRRPLTYSLKTDKIYMLAVAMDQMVTRISIMDVRNRHLAGIHKIDLPLLKNHSALTELCEKIEDILLKSGIDRKKIIGAGVGMPGFIDTRKGINYSFLDIHAEESSQQFLQQRLQMPVFIDNDSSLIALAESRFGIARNHKNVMVINMGWGIGLGMILNGELFRGHNGFAGEFSHIPLFNNNKLCRCGKSGCLETETSLLVVIEKLVEGLRSGRRSGLPASFPSGNAEQDWNEISIAASKGDRFTIEALSQAGYQIGKGIAILVHIINPELIILSGRGALAGKVWMAPVQQALNEHCIPRLAAHMTVQISSLGHEAELIGAAALVMEHIADPLSPIKAGKPKNIAPA